MKRLRRALLEFWAIVLMAAVVGFLGPFGTYLEAEFPSLVWRWWLLLMGAYILVRPLMLFWRWVARSTHLPQGSMVFWGVTFCSAPMALLWRVAGRDETRMLGDYSGLFPFSLLCSLAIMAVVWWAERADAHLARYYKNGQIHVADALANLGPRSPAEPSKRPRLYLRLSRPFKGDILALESEDHYVRVHGAGQSELLFLRLRDAIAEMDGQSGAQIHRSWWVARDAVAEVTGNGRNREVRLVNGVRAPVARDSVSRLQRAGFLPD